MVGEILGVMFKNIGRINRTIVVPIVSNVFEGKN